MSYNPNNPNGQAVMANSEPVVIASDQSPIPVDLAKDMFEHAIVAGRYNQVEISFDQTDPDLIADVTVTKTNGGDASNLNGQAVFTTGSNTSGGIKCVTDNTVVYRPNAEIFAEFTCIFTTGIANSYQRIGAYDTNNGFFIGYEGTSFGVTIRKAGVDTTTARASFNVDTLTGAANSKYTRNGVPETLDTTKDNLYRIRFGWLGAAPIVFEVLSPDGEWVLFHIIRHPNTTAGTSINNPDLPITLDAQKTSAGATVLTMSTACWAIGTSSDLQKVSSTLTDNTLVKPVRSVLVAKLPNSSYANIDATAGGNLKVSVEELDPGVTVPVTGTVTANAGTGTMNVSVQNATLAVTDNNGSLTVDGTVSANQAGNWSITNITGTVSLPTGASTAANQSTIITAVQLLDDVVATDGSAALTKLYQVGGTDGTNAQILSTNVSGHLNIADGGNSITVDGTVAATQSGTWNINNISGTVSLPTGAATETTLSALNTKVPSGLTVTSTRLLVDGSGVTQPVSGTVTVQDGGGSITVDGTVAATQSGTWSTRTQDGAGNAVTSHLAGSSRGIDVSIIDGSGNQITAFGGGTQYTEGDVDATITGTAMLWEDTSDTLRAVSAAKPLPVNIVSGAASGTEYADGTTVATPTGGAILGWDGTAVQVVRTDSTGVLAIQDNGSSITVDGSVSVSNFPATQAVSGTVTVQDGGGSITVDGTVAATQSGTWNIGTLTSITNTVTVSGTVTANAGTGTFNTSDANAVSQSTATAAQKGYLSLAGVTATLPTYTTGNTNAMTMTTTGLLRVDGSNVTQPVSGTVTADTELPTAAALADGAANPTTPTTGAANLGFNGTTWDRIRSEGTNTDAEATASVGAMSTCSHSTVFNGTTWDRMRSAAALDGTAATSHTGILGVLQPGKRFDPANLGTAANSTSSVDVNGSNSITLGVETTTTGTFTIEATSDGINWGAPEVFDASADLWVSGLNLTPTAGKTYQILAGGFRSVRIRTVTTLGATMAHAFNASMSQGYLAAIDTGAAPHNFGYTLFHRDAEYTAQQTGTVLFTPSATTRKFAITDFTISVAGTTSGVVTLFDAPAGTTTYNTSVPSTTPAIFRGSFAPSATANPGVTKTFNVPFVSAAANNTVHLTTSAAMTVYVQFNGYEI